MNKNKDKPGIKKKIKISKKHIKSDKNTYENTEVSSNNSNDIDINNKKKTYY